MRTSILPSIIDVKGWILTVQLTQKAGSIDPAFLRLTVSFLVLYRYR